MTKFLSSLLGLTMLSSVAMASECAKTLDAVIAQANNSAKVMFNQSPLVQTVKGANAKYIIQAALEMVDDPNDPDVNANEATLVYLSQSSQNFIIFSKDGCFIDGDVIYAGTPEESMFLSAFKSLAEKPL